MFQILVYFDGVTTACQINCRHLGTTTKIKKGEYVQNWSKISTFVFSFVIVLFATLILFFVDFL